MSISLKKNVDKVCWYYSKDGTQVGPFETADLVLKIDADTMVWREGIEWTTASLVPELLPFFPVQNSQPFTGVSSIKSFPQGNDNSAVEEPRKMFSAPFSFDGRICRTEYGISVIIYVVAILFLENWAKSNSVIALGIFPMLWFLWAQGAKRCHDRGASGWYQIIPFYGFWMLFAEGQAHENEYGEPPK